MNNFRGLADDAARYVSFFHTPMQKSKRLQPGEINQEILIRLESAHFFQVCGIVQDYTLRHSPLGGPNQGSIPGLRAAHFGAPTGANRGESGARYLPIVSFIYAHFTT